MEAPDTVIGGKYRLIRKLGQGGMGSVWLAEHLTLSSQVAIKLIDSSIIMNPEALSRFMREARAAAALRSPHVVQVLDHGVDNGTPYIAMELLEGESLADRLERVGRLPPLEVARIMTHVARAMSRAHEAGIVHRDLKPDNVFIVRNDDEEIAKVLDFGVAKTSAPGAVDAAISGTTRTGSVLGTPYYMSPEQAEGSKSLDHRTDIWAMGVIAFECLLGVKPFDGETLGGLLIAICSRPMPVPSRFGEVPDAFDEWFARACERDVTRRWPTAKEAASTLKFVCGGEPTEVLPGTAVATGAHPAAATHAVAARSAASHPGGRTSAGFSSSQLGVSDASSARSSRPLLFGLAAAAVVVVAGGAFAWSKLGVSHGDTAASEPGTASAAASAPVIAVAPAPTPPEQAANPAPPPSAAPPAESTTAASSAHAAPAAKHPAGAHAAAAKHNDAAPPKATSAAAPPAPPKAPAPPKVNLGI